MASSRQPRFNAVAYECDGVWLVQGIEWDIRARAASEEDAPAAFLRAVRERIALDEHLGRKPLQGLRAAPPQFVEMFESARRNRRRASNDGDEVEVRLVA
jgi:hypothetical protein